MPIKINGTNTAANPSITGDDTDTGIVYGSDQIDFSTGGSSKVTLNGSDLGIGTSSPDRTVHCHNSSNTTNVRAKFSNGTTGEGASDGFEIGINASDPAQAVLVNYEASPIAFFTGGTERIRVDESGHIRFSGTTEEIKLNTSDGSDNGFLNLSGGGECSQLRGSQVVMYGNEYSGQEGKLLLMAGNSGNANGFVGFYTGGSQRMTVDSSGNVLVGTTSTTVESLTSAGKGVKLSQSGRMLEVASNAQPAVGFNRTGDDGTIVRLIGQGSVEGTISVSGSSVSYNGGHLSRWSQIKGLSTTDKSARPTIYQGTVMSNLDDLCVWEGEDNQQLNMTKVSDVVGDKDVAGIFYTWDDDDDKYVNDFYVAMTGDMVIRVAASTTVARGDLLISAGDGTAKPQADDIVRSSTIAKIISTTSTATYADGSKAYPCVLMAC